MIVNNHWDNLPILIGLFANHKKTLMINYWGGRECSQCGGKIHIQLKEITISGNELFKNNILLF